MKFEELKIGQVCQYNKGNKQVYKVTYIDRNDNTAILAYRYGEGRYCAIHFEEKHLQFFNLIKSAKVV